MVTETKTVFIEIGLEVFLGQTMIRIQDERLCFADHDVQPVSRPEF